MRLYPEFVPWWAKWLSRALRVVGFEILVTREISWEHTGEGEWGRCVPGRMIGLKIAKRPCP